MAHNELTDKGAARTDVLLELLSWATERMKAETSARPDENIYKRTLLQTWCQVIRKIEEELRASTNLD